MDVLIISKTTNLELHGRSVMRRVASGHLSKQHLDFLKKAHDDHYETLGMLYGTLKSHGISYHEIGRGLYWPDFSKFSVVITVGGDGTVLEASHHMGRENRLLLGIRSSSTSVGHLCYADIHTLNETIEQLTSNQISCLEISRLKAEIHVAETGGIIKTDPILNDFLYANLSPAAMTRYRLYLGQTQEEHKSSGIWIATPAGSTAGVAAAGGKAMSMTDVEHFQYWVRELFVPPHRESLALKNGFFNPDELPLTIENLNEQALLALDGQHGQILLHFGDRIEFMRAVPIKLAVRHAGK